jgi:hypothetical protein
MKCVVVHLAEKLVENCSKIIKTEREKKTQIVSTSKATRTEHSIWWSTEYSVCGDTTVPHTACATAPYAMQRTRRDSPYQDSPKCIHSCRLAFFTAINSSRQARGLQAFFNLHLVVRSDDLASSAWIQGLGHDLSSVILILWLIIFDAAATLFRLLKNAIEVKYFLRLAKFIKE